MIFKAGGVRRQYRLQFSDGKVAIVRRNGSETLLTACEYPVSAGETYRLAVAVDGSKIRAYVNGEEVLAYIDASLPARGIVGATVADGTVARFDRFMIKEV